MFISQSDCGIRNSMWQSVSWFLLIKKVELLAMIMKKSFISLMPLCRFGFRYRKFFFVG